MDSDRNQGRENHAASAASGDQLGRNSVSVVFLPLLWLRGIISLVGDKVDIKTGAAIIAVLQIVVTGFVQTSGPLAAPELENGTMSHDNSFPLVSQNVDSAKYVFWQSRKLDSRNCTCPCSVPGFFPALSKWEMTSNGFIVVCLSSGIQWTSMEQQKLFMLDSENFNMSKPFDTCQVPVYAHTVKPHNCESIPGAHLMKGKLTSSCSKCQKIKESDQCDSTGPSEANVQDQVNDGLMRTDVGSGENSVENNNLHPISNFVKFHKNNFWCLLALLVLLLDGTICQTRDIMIGFLVIILLGLGIPGILKNILPSTSISWFIIPFLMHLIAYTLMLLSLIMTVTRRRVWLSHFLAGAAYTSATLGILGIIVSPLPLEYACYCVSILVFLLLLAVLYGYTPDEADPRTVED